VLRRFKFTDKRISELVKGRRVIWVHAVSLGEVSTCKSLIRQLSLRYPKKLILITTITSTGKMLAESMQTNNVLSLYMPLDLSFLVKSFVRHINPELLILIETELWPNLLYCLQERNIPILVLNARLSDRSFGKYHLFSYFIKKLSIGIKMFCVQSTIDKERFLSLGFDDNRVKVTGNMKFDAIEELDDKQFVEIANIKNRISLEQKDFLVVAGSTHKGEEEYILDVFLDLKKHFHDVRLLIAPRHLERLDSIEFLIKQKGMKSERMSKNNQVTKESVLLLDTIGQLRLIYSLADLVFIGGSLVPVGGHNILEPAFFQKPIVVGPYMHNFRSITQLFLQNQALIQVNNYDEFKLALRELISNKDRLIDLGSAAKSVIVSKRGAMHINFSIIQEHVL